MKVKESGELVRCQVGHVSHDTLTIELHLRGQHHGILDVANIPLRLKTKIKMTVFDWRQYLNAGGYCPADDVVSYSIYTQGVWEAFETVLFLDILSKGDNKNMVLDIGANVGWYSVLAGKWHYPVMAFDCDTDIAELWNKNIEQNDVESAVLLEMKIDEHTPTVNIADEQLFEFVKCDIEGNERYAFKMCERLFREQRIKYALFEVSPVFNDSYPQLMRDITECGYEVYRMPDKSFEHKEEYTEEPLATLTKYCKVDTDDWDEYLKQVSQDDFIFIRKDLV